MIYESQEVKKATQSRFLRQDRGHAEAIDRMNIRLGKALSTIHVVVYIKPSFVYL